MIPSYLVFLMFNCYRSYSLFDKFFAGLFDKPEIKVRSVSCFFGLSFYEQTV